MTKLRMSQSIARDWNTCKHMYKLIHVDRLRRRSPTRPMQVGTLTHKGIEAFLRLQHVNYIHKVSMREKDYMQAVQEAVQAKQDEHTNALGDVPLGSDWHEESQNQVEVASILTMRTMRKLGMLDPAPPWRTVCLNDGTPLIEYEIILDKGWYELGGTLDWVAERVETGFRYLFDWKSRENLQPPEFDSRQTQTPLYTELLRIQEELDIKGTGTIQIRRRLREKPRLNKTKKKGELRPGMSRGSIATDWETYRAALIEEGLDPDDYEDMRYKLKEFTSISFEPRTQAERDSVMRDMHLTAADINRTPPDEMYRARSPMNCNMCRMESLCSAQLYGHDADWIRKTEYMDRDSPEFIEVLIEEDENAHLAD